MKWCIATLAIAAVSLSGDSVQAASLRGIGDAFEDQIAVALGGHHKQDCVNDCMASFGVSKETCKDCCKQGKERTGKWTCDAPEPAPAPAPEPVGQRCGGQRRPQCGSGQAGTRQERAKCCPNDHGSFQFECVFLGESCPTPTPAPTPVPEPVGQGCDGQRMPQCGSGQAGTRQEMAKCCPNDHGSFQFECVFLGESCPTPAPAPAPAPRKKSMVGQRCGGQRRPRCGSGQAGTRQERAKCCPNDHGSFQFECVFRGESCPTPAPAPAPEPVGQGCDGQRRPQCGSGQAGTRQERAKCCPNDSGSFQFKCVFLGESCPTPAPTPAPWEYPGGEGGQCAKSCRKDDDCFKGGFVMCGVCNKVGGTRGVNTCINPPDDVLELEDEEFEMK